MTYTAPAPALQARCGGCPHSRPRPRSRDWWRRQRGLGEGDDEGVQGFVLQAFDDEAALVASQAAQAGG